MTNQANTLPAELVNAKSLKTKGAAVPVTRKYFEDHGKTEFKEALAKEGTEAGRYLKVIQQCEDADDWDIFAKAFRKAALMYLAADLGKKAEAAGNKELAAAYKAFDPSKGEKTWTEALKGNYKARFYPQFYRIKKIGAAFSQHGKGWLLETMSKKGPTLQQRIAEMANTTKAGVKAPKVQSVESKAKADAKTQEAKKPEPANFNAIVQGIAHVHEDFLVSLVQAIAIRCNASNVPEWQALSKEAFALVQTYDKRTGESHAPAKAVNGIDETEADEADDQAEAA